MGNKQVNAAAKEILANQNAVPKAKFGKIFKEINKDKSGSLDSDQLAIFIHEALNVIAETQPQYSMAQLCGSHGHNYLNLGEYKSRGGILKDDMAVASFVAKIVVDVCSAAATGSQVEARVKTNIEAAWDALAAGNWLVKIVLPGKYGTEATSPSFEGTLTAQSNGKHSFSLSGNLTKKNNGPLRQEYDQHMDNFPSVEKGHEYINQQEFTAKKFGVNAAKVDHVFICENGSELSRANGFKLVLQSSEFNPTITFKTLPTPNQIGIGYQLLQADLDDSDCIGFHCFSETPLFIVGAGAVKKWEEYFEEDPTSFSRAWEFAVKTDNKTKCFVI